MLESPKDKAAISFALLLKPFLWLYEDKITWRYYFETLLNPFVGSNSKHLGLKAQRTFEGFAKDGSYYHTGFMTGQVPSPDAKFQETLSHIQESKGFYTHHLKINTIHLSRLKEIIEKLEDAGVKTYIFIPPIAPSIVKQIAESGSKLQHIDDFFDRLTFLNKTIYNFHNPAALRSTDCEFIDGCHGGEVLYLKMLLNMAEQDKTKILNAYLNQDYIKNSIKQYHHLAMIPDEKITTLKEIDYLQLGCHKDS